MFQPDQERRRRLHGSTEDSGRENAERFVEEVRGNDPVGVKLSVSNEPGGRQRRGTP